MGALERLGLVVLVVYGSVTGVEGCAARYKKELRYLDLYLGIAPTSEGQLPEKEPTKFVQYIGSARDLACTFQNDCLWQNLDDEGVLDTSQFYHFNKHNTKSFPRQLQPGRFTVEKGTHFALAGNNTVNPQSAVLISAPIPCQRGDGVISFDYWLYNYAQVQVIIVKAAKRRKHLQIILKPEMDCHINRPHSDRCKVKIPHVDEPFRIAIRAFSLKDNIVGSMALITNIAYDATICEKSPLNWIFGSEALYTDLSRSQPILSLDDLNCTAPPTKCRWANIDHRAVSKWRLGKSTERWSEIMMTGARSSRPGGNFLFLAVDSLTPKPFNKLSSDFVPCTQKPTTLTFRNWMKVGTQVEVCSVDEEGVPLSCAYLGDDDADGPVEIVVDAYAKPFRFTMEIVNFDAFSGGLIAITDIKLKGLLCSQEAPPVVTTIQPNTVANRFALTPRPFFNGQYPLQLTCDWTSDPCFQWVDEEAKLFVGVAPDDSEDFPFPEDIVNGQVGVIMLSGADTAVLRSREIPCAFNLKVTLTYWRSEHGFIRMCALGECADGGKTYGKIILKLSSMRPFEIALETRSRADSIVVIDSILVEGDVCPLKTLEQTLCDNVKCEFQGSFCGYDTKPVSIGDVPLRLAHKGATVTIEEGNNRAVLASSNFELIQPALLVVNVTQETFGSRVLLCPDAKSEPDSCDELMGPIVLSKQTKRLQYPLDPTTRRFAVVLLHDKAAQFGPATFTVHSVEIRTSDDYQLCF